MNRRLAHLLVRLYPRDWRERYGAEFEEFLQDGPGGPGASADIVRSAICEHLSPTRGGNMDHTNSFGGILRQPSAFLPLAMSIIALAMLLGDAVMFGVVHGGDEDAVAHLWQLLMTVQMPVVAFFAIKWLRRAPRQTLLILALQAGAWLASCAPVYFLHL
jgi:hypothetical protein